MTLTPLIAVSLACVLPLPVDAHLQGPGAESAQQPALVSPLPPHYKPSLSLTD